MAWQRQQARVQTRGNDAPRSRHDTTHTSNKHCMQRLASDRATRCRDETARGVLSSQRTLQKQAPGVLLATHNRTMQARQRFTHE